MNLFSPHPHLGCGVFIIKITSFVPEGSVSYTYDANGNVLTVTDKTGTVSREYDALNRVISYTDTYGKVIRYEYDAVGNLTRMVYPDNTAVNYTYDANHNLIRVTDWANRVTAYTYDVNNRVVGVTKPDGSVTTTVYDSKQRVTSTVEKTASGVVITGFEYTYDALLRIIEEKVLVNSTKLCYTYDSLSRVTKRTIKDISDVVLSEETFTYDAAGNITDAPDSCFGYDTNNRLVVFNGQTVKHERIYEMRKSHQVVLNLIFPLFANVVWVYASYYQRRISGSFSTPNIVFDALLSVLLSICLLIVFARNKTLYTKGAFKLRGQPDKIALLAKFVVLLALRGLLDAALPYVAGAFADWRYFTVDWLIILYWILVYIVAVRKDTAIWKHPKCLIALLAAVMVILGVSFAYDVGLTQQYAILTDKYTQASPYLARASENLDFQNSLNAFIVDTAMVFVLVLIHSLGAIRREELKDDSEYAKSIRRIKRDQSIFRTFIRCNFIIAFVCIWAVVHMIVVPESSLILNLNNETYFKTNFEGNGIFNPKIVENAVHIGFGYLTEENACYYTQEIVLQGGLSPEVFVLNGSEPNLILTDTGEQMSHYMEYSIDGNDVYLYGYYAICYYENGAPQIVRMEELGACENSVILTELCKDLLSDGNLFAFEYGCEYLLKYDTEFIKPYIERYANGVFTDTENEWLTNSFYRAEYITGIAKSLSK